MTAPIITLAERVLSVRFSDRQRMLSWSLTRPGAVTTHTVAWLKVDDADLPIDVDPATVLRKRLEAAGHADAVQLMTSRDVRKHHQARHAFGAAKAFCLATVGLANAGRVGAAQRSHEQAGTINLVAQIDQALDDAGLLEAMSIAAQARTAAVIDLGLKRDGLLVTGTGTDCIVVACPSVGPRQTYAGLHTDIGRAIGAVVYDAVLAGGQEWAAENIGKWQAGDQQ
jgi:adenosylcobinamide amidohydrolase